MMLDEDGYPIVVEPGKKRNEWFDSNGKIAIPLQYKLQLGFYLNLRKINAGIYAIAFLNPTDYKYPHLFKIEEHEVRYVWLFIDTKEFQKLMDIAKSWFFKHVKSGISPVMTEEDKIWLSHEMKKMAWVNE
jgi:hypothetical protein